ncbi:GntR family transcriptional regulator [Priestia megaterium]|nr:GntR family transcriptional regulator [Priestia megaterium]
MSHMIDRKSSIPIYLQIVEQLRQIVTCSIEENREKIYTDSELMEMFGVSRWTIQRAVQVLVAERILKRVKGRGTFITYYEKLEDNLESLDKFVNECYQNPEVQRELLVKKIVPCPTWVADKLRIKPFEDVIYIKCLQLVKDVPAVVDNHYMQLKFGQKISDEEFINTSLIHIFSKKFNVNIIKSDIEIEARLADKEIAELLDIQEGSPVLYRYSDLKAEGFGCVVAGNSFFRADKYKHKSIVLREI